MGRLFDINEALEEVRRLIEEGYSYLDAIEKVKGYFTDQSKSNLKNEFKDIISPKRIDE